VTRLFVSDTSVLIELERASLLELAFALPYEFIVPDLLYKRELRAEGGPALINLGLTIAELDPAEVGQAQEYQRLAPSISLPDAFALVLAKARAEALLTGDQNLRRLAEAEAVTCRGVLWVLDRMLEEKVASAAALYHGLTAISLHPRCRLPKAEMRSRRHNWAALTGITVDD
jgi:hypothetical protein